MKPSELYERASAIFLEACDLRIEERAAFLDSACAGQDDLRSEVESLLAYDPQEQSSSGTRVSEQLAALAKAVDGEEYSEQIGRYRIMRPLGEGGMGAVFLAEQDRPRRTVALKVLRPGIASRRMLRRFTQEIELLGRLHHPGIAQVFEADSADAGHGRQPYFAMEYVDGLPLTRYAVTKSLSIRQRLELLAAVCDAVQHAHQRGVIHRDLKPANILVGDQGQPKVLDFGIARAMDDQRRTGTLQTDAGQIIGTVPYMSPEQILGNRELDHRTDVYSLGVIGYELLAERLPFDLRGQSLPEASRIVQEHEAPRLGEVDRRLRGDVETLISKALEKSREHRYASAADLADDIRRYLQDEPLVARPPGAWEQLRKLARRNRALFGGAIVALSGLLIGTGFATWQAVRATQDRNRAVAAEQRATAVNEFLRDMLGSVDPLRDGRNVKVVDVLGRASRRAEQTFAEQPEIAAALHAALGQSYFGLGLWPEARHEFSAAAEGFGRTLGPTSVEALDARHGLVLAFQVSGNLSAAVPLAVSLVQDAEGLGKTHPRRLAYVTTLAKLDALRGRPESAQEQLRDNLRVQQVVLAEDHPDILETRAALAEVLQHLRRFAEAERLTRSVLEARTELLGPEHPDTIASLRRLRILVNRPQPGRNPRERGELTERLLELETEVLGPDHPHTRQTQLDQIMQKIGNRDPAAAEVHIREMLNEVREEDLDSIQTLRLRQTLAGVLARQQKWEELETVAREILAQHRNLLDARNPVIGHALHELGRTLLRQNKLIEAEQVLGDAVAQWREVGPRDPHTTVGVWAEYARTVALQGDHLAAELALAEAIGLVEEQLEPKFLVGPVLELVIAKLRQGKLLDAEATLQPYRELLNNPPGGRRPSLLELNIAEYLMLTGDLSAARDKLDEFSARATRGPRRLDQATIERLEEELDALLAADQSLDRP